MADASAYEPSVDHGQIFTNTEIRTKNLSSNLNKESDPAMHSVGRGVRTAKSEPVSVTEREGKFSVSTCQYPGKKDQDRFMVQLSADMQMHPHYLGLFDGHGTSVFAADLCVKEMTSRSFRKREASEILPSDEAIIDAYRGIHQVVCENVRQHPRSGTTAVTVFIAKHASNGNTLIKAAWCGDSRAIMINMLTGKTKALTKDHSLSANPEEVQRINDASHAPREGLLESPLWAIEEQMSLERGVRARCGSFVGRRELNGREAGPLVVFAYTGGVSLQVSRSIGDALAARSCIADPEISSFDLPREEERTRIIVASDGLWDVYTTEQAGRMVHHVQDCTVAARKLALAARAKRTQMGRTMDDITVIVMDLGEHVSKSGKHSATATTATTSTTSGGAKQSSKTSDCVVS